MKVSEESNFSYFPSSLVGSRSFRDLFPHAALVVYLSHVSK